ncbi:MAG: hypothetical protein WBA42_14890 [Mesorhizobium sp.]
MKLKLALAATTALVLMTGMAMADSNDAVSNQSGNDNSTDIVQSSTSNNGHRANSDVIGNHNTISIDQNSTSAAHGNASVLVNGDNGQGDYNAVTLTQSSFQGHSIGSGEHQTAAVDIHGDGNIVNGTQKYGTDYEQNKLTVTIRGNGEGSGNAVDVYQGGNGETSTTTIWGDGNDVDVNQGSGHNTATIYIDGNAGDGEGSGNKLDVRQDHNGVSFGNGLTGNTAQITVFGDGNNASANGGFFGDMATLAAGLTPGSIVQSGAANLVTLNVGSNGFDSNSNAFAVRQAGTSNSLTGNILGNHNQSVVAQSGDSNITTLLQSGDYNGAAVSQVGSTNSTAVSQMGNGNATTVTQN